jgi:hypothetical protein
MNIFEIKEKHFVLPALVIEWINCQNENLNWQTAIRF